MSGFRAGAPVVAGVDGSDSALEAVRWAAREAARRGSPLRLVNAFGWMSTERVTDPGLGDSYREVLLDAARDEVARAAAAATETAPGVQIDRQVSSGYPVAVLTNESASAQLVVVGNRGLGGFSGLLAGSVAIALAAHAACPVVVVRDGEDGHSPEDGPVVVGVDGSALSEAALAFAYAAADARRVPLVAVHAWHDLLVDPTMAPLLDWPAIEADERLQLAERLAGWGEKYPDVVVQRLVTRDRPARALVEESGRAQLVVVGSRGRGGMKGLMLGSVSQALLHHSVCPVAIVRPTDDGTA
ncbi:universal stress protein [Pseudonocardia acidicola]|uniref:Universal stress protein n=1 Tax=Pseudonocardia acidicola TaxID=2724939 RepID=A0ABX1SCL3_9PSEU|nr:universal stress protein [Pseudonocardia acidicola]NMH99306.1 universal stress protein [Pseudonocardia acidicola]